MSEPSDYDRVHAVFVSVCDLAPAERHAALARACDGDDALRGKVEALLAYHDRAEGPLERPVVTADAAADGADGASRTAGTLPPASPSRSSSSAWTPARSSPASRPSARRSP
ncbi:MAG: hypothetical protein ACYTG3_21740 [Planctomycetota bacterium]|jgi:hypothetical protein